MIASRSRGVAACSTSCTGSIRAARSSRFDAASKIRTRGPNSRRYQVVDQASRRATGSGRAMARFLGKSSPATICTAVANSSASTVPIATPTAVGTPATPSSSPSPAPISGSAT
jgi:hypothetical protein